MPEGDSVYQAAARLDQALGGSVVTRCDLRVPKLATADLTGELVTEVVARGKHLLTRFGNGWTLHSHLRMEGRWQIFPDGAAWRGGPAHQIRAILGVEGSTAVGYRISMLDLVRTREERRLVGHLGPDLIGSGWDKGEAQRRLLAEPGRAIGEALLDQRNLAGIGNIYKSEVCFLRGISPWTQVGDVPELPDVLDLAHRLLEANKDSPLRVTTGDSRPGRNLWVYGRKQGGVCPRCGTLVRSADQGPAGEERTTYWCPTCQPGPGPGAGSGVGPGSGGGPQYRRRREARF